MTRRKRLTLFLGCTVVFIVSTVLMLAYSFGYRLSPDEWSIVQAGGLAVKATPSVSARIFVNGKLLKETSLISRRLTLGGLTPRTYNVKVERTGYHSWEKSLAVKPELVTDVDAFLIKKDQQPIRWTQNDSYARMSFVDADQEIIALTSENKKTSIYIDGATGTILTKPSFRLASSSPALSKRAKAFIHERGITAFRYDPYGERLLWWDTDALHVRWLQGEDYLPLYTERTEIEIRNIAGGIRTAEWYPGREGLLVAHGDSISALELDPRDRRNIYPIFTGSKPDILVSSSNELLYILSDHSLSVLPIE
ncbi:MAG: hypothetical protein AAB372_02690 [Patescibacteria group bacterium]